MSRSILIAPEALSVGFVAAAVASVPAAVRVAGTSVGLLPAWFAVAAFLAGPLVISIGAARLARRWLGVVPPQARLGLALWGLFWAGISFPLEAGFGALLKTATHHRGLGGATFAAVALVINLGALVGGYRMALVALPAAWRHPKLTRWGVGAALVVVVVLLTMATGGVVAADVPVDPSFAYYSSPVQLDAALAMLAATAGVLTDIPPARGPAVSWIAGGSLVALVSIGWASVLHWPTLVRDVSERAPLAATLGQLLAPSSEPDIRPISAPLPGPPAPGSGSSTPLLPVAPAAPRAPDVAAKRTPR
jgi:hypothetical protein